jgi:predicted ATPase
LRAGLPFGLVMQLAEQARGTFGDGGALGTQTQDAWAEFLAGECEAGPVLIVIEDLQWGDAMSVRALDIALRDLHDAPLMVVAFARPEVHQLFPKLWSERAIEEIRLPPLTKTASERLVRNVLGAAAVQEDVARIVETAEGIPLYLVALAQAAARGATDIPDAVLAMVQSRYDGLDANARKVLRAASIFGRSFWRGGVEALTGSDVQVAEGLEDLEEAKLIASQPEGRFSGEQEYQFRTSLLREGAYAMLIEGDRALGHVLAASWLERVGEQDSSVIDTHRELGRLSVG